MNRGCSTYNKQPRRYRLWLKDSTVALIYARSQELCWGDRREQVMVENILEAWAKHELDWPSRAGGSPAASSTGPVELVKV